MRTAFGISSAALCLLIGVLTHFGIAKVPTAIHLTVVIAANIFIYYAACVRAFPRANLEGIDQWFYGRLVYPAFTTGVICFSTFLMTPLEVMREWPDNYSLGELYLILGSFCIVFGFLAIWCFAIGFRVFRYVWLGR